MQQFVLDETCARHGLMGKNGNWPMKKCSRSPDVLGFLTEHPEPVPISLLNEQMTEMAPFFEKFVERGRPELYSLSHSEQ